MSHSPASYGRFRISSPLPWKSAHESVTSSATVAGWSRLAKRLTAQSLTGIPFFCDSKKDEGAKWLVTSGTTRSIRPDGAPMSERNERVGASHLASWFRLVILGQETSVVDGFHKSWQSVPRSMTRAASPSSRSRDTETAASSKASNVCVQTFPSGCQCGSCGVLSRTSSSGWNRATSHMAFAATSQREGLSDFSRSFFHSSQILSLGSSPSDSSMDFINETLSDSISRPNLETNCSAR